VTSSALSLDSFPRLLAAVQRAPGQQVFLADRSGMLAFYTGRPDLTEAQRDVSAFEPVRSALASKPFAGEVVDPLFGDRRLVVTTRTPAYGWVVGVSIPVDVALAEVQTAQRNALLIFTGAVALSVGLALFLAGWLARPLKRLTAGAAALGAGDLEQRVNVHTGDELEELGTAFNRMADQISLREAQREDYIRIVSHDLRNPLAAIQGQAQLLQRRLRQAGLLGGEWLGADAIVTSTQRMNAMIQELVDSARLEAGQVQLNRRPVDLPSFIADARRRLSPSLEAGRIRIEPAPGLPPVSADPDRLERILANLLTNALKYSTPGTPVVVSFAQRDGEVVTSVSDQGPGIPPEELARLFQRYYRTTAARERREGLGLGLYITHKLVEAHGGAIWAESEVGKGSTFSFSLPQA
jgi:signal transduction histidine kinase